MSAPNDSLAGGWKGRPSKAGLIVLAALIAERGAEWVVTAIIDGRPAAGAATPTTATSPSAVGRGELAYRVHCARCHGPEGRGDGPDAASFKVPPADLASILAPWPDDRIRRSIVEGKPGTPMPAFGQVFSDRQLGALVDHLRSFRAPASSPPPDPERSRLADRLRRAGFEPEPGARPAPRLEVRDDRGRVTSLDQLRGRLVLVAFWGTSCAPCREELPGLRRLADRLGDAGLSVLPVCVDTDDPTEARAALAGHVEGLPAACDTSGLARLQYDVQALPTTVLVSRSGDLIGSARGGRDWSAPETIELIESCLR